MFVLRLLGYVGLSCCTIWLSLYAKGMFIEKRRMNRIVYFIATIINVSLLYFFINHLFM